MAANPRKTVKSIEPNTEKKNFNIFKILTILNTSNN